MKQNLSKLLKASFAIAAIGILAASSALLLVPILDRPQAEPVFVQKAAESYAGFSPTVIDGRTGQPIENAEIVIPETSAHYRTNAEGKTGEIRIEYSAKSDYDAILPKDWCEITLLAYADGYAPYALFYLQLRENTVRSGPTLMLFPGAQDPFSIIEGPPEKWVSALIEQYRP